MEEATAISYRPIAEWLSGAEMVWVPLHVSPDGDTLGSSLAFAGALRAEGYRCEVVSPDPIPVSLASLYDPEALHVGDVPPGPPPTHIACLDISDPTRTGGFYRANEAAFRGESAVRVLNLDHHATNLGYGDLQLLDTGAPACAEQIAIALDELGWPIDKETAHYLLLGIVTDTLGFRTPSTTPRTLRIAARLQECGADLFRIVDEVYNSRPLSTIMLWSKALGSVKLGAGGRVIYTQITPAMLEEAGATEDDLEGLSSYLATVRGEVKVAAVLKEREDGATRVSFRSQPGTDVSLIAKHFGGGGHPQAAGATIPATGEEAERLFLQACEASLDQTHGGVAT
jgi:bifunctional oligoribonuclease and PAP phosphatase NrnA